MCKCDSVWILYEFSLDATEFIGAKSMATAKHGCQMNPGLKAQWSSTSDAKLKYGKQQHLKKKTPWRNWLWLTEVFGTGIYVVQA